MVNIYILEALIVPHAKLSFTDPCSEVQKSKIINVSTLLLQGIDQLFIEDPKQFWGGQGFSQ